MIHPITPNDIEAVTAIYNYYITNTIVSFEEESISTNEMNQRVHSVLSSGFPWLVAEQADEIIGYAYANRWNVRTAYKYSAEVTVYLSNLNTLNGWGTKLYDELFTELKAMSIHTVIGGISLPNPASVALHEKCGMTKVAHYKEVGYKFNKWIDVGYWQGEL
jgi:phosphinothricin acetyltransferase